MIHTNNRHRGEHRRKIQQTFDDSPMYVDIRQSVRDLRPLHPEMTPEQFARWYERKYRIKAEEVLHVLREMEEGSKKGDAVT